MPGSKSNIAVDKDTLSSSPLDVIMVNDFFMAVSVAGFLSQ